MWKYTVIELVATILELFIIIIMATFVVIDVYVYIVIDAAVTPSDVISDMVLCMLVFALLCAWYTTVREIYLTHSK